jgi:hypothetical protein
MTVETKGEERIRNCALLLTFLLASNHLFSSTFALGQV